MSALHTNHTLLVPVRGNVFSVASKNTNITIGMKYSDVLAYKICPLRYCGVPDFRTYVAVFYAVVSWTVPLNVALLLLFNLAHI